MFSTVFRRVCLKNNQYSLATRYLSGSVRTQVLGAAVEKALNHQLQAEAEASHYYLACAGWAERRGYLGSATFMYAQYEEERRHMMKLIRYINDRGGEAIIPALPQPTLSVSNLFQLFQSTMSHEQKVTACVNAALAVSLTYCLSQMC